MQIISVDKINNLHLFPYFYLKEYTLFIKETEGKDVVFWNDENGNTLVCKTWTNKFLKLLQPTYPPLNNKGERLSKKQEQNFLNDFLLFINKFKLAHRVVQPENFAIFKSVPKYAVSVPFGTYYINLEKYTEDELFGRIHPKHRNVIKNAEKNNVVVKYGYECINDFYVLYRQTMHRSNMYCQDVSYFTDLYKKLNQSSICGVVYCNNIPQGGLFSLYTGFGAFYLYGASAEKIDINGSINYLHWNTIKLLKQKGVKRYDFVGARLSDVSGTKLHGIQQFKQRFGAELETGFLWKKDINVFDCLVFDELIGFRAKLRNEKPLLDIIDEELLKNKTSYNNPTLTDRLALKMKEKSKPLIKKIRTFKKEINTNELEDDLVLAGINEGDTLMVHSSLSKIGNIQDGAKTVITSLLRQIGENGNLVMPAYSYIDSMENTAHEKDYVFNPLTTPSVVGKITEEFRKWPNVKRSLHPTHAVCAYGPQADFITEGHLNAETNFGLNTPFHRVRELKGKIVGLGVNIGPVTIYHSVEDFYPDQFQGVYLLQPEPIKINVNGKEIAKSIFLHDHAFHNTRIDKTKVIESWMRNHLKKKGILHESPFGLGTIWWMDIQELFDEQIELKKQGISIYKVPELA